MPGAGGRVRFGRCLVAVGSDAGHALAGEPAAVGVAERAGECVALAGTRTRAGRRRRHRVREARRLDRGRRNGTGSGRRCSGAPRGTVHVVLFVTKLTADESDPVFEAILASIEEG